MKKRLFLAINFPESIRNELYSLRLELERMNPSTSIKWVEKENIHLTVFFVGEYEEEDIPKLSTVLKNTIPHIPFPFEIRPELGGFPNIKEPSVLFVKVKDSQRLRELVTGVEKAIATLDIEERNKLFHPHITLARIKGGENITTDLDILIRERECTIETLDLMESTAPDDSQQYILIERISLL